MTLCIECQVTLKYSIVPKQMFMRFQISLQDVASLKGETASQKKRKLPALRHLLNGLSHAQVGIDRLRRQLKVALLPLDLLAPSPS